MHVEDLPSSLVIDASVGLKWVIDEPGSDIAAALVQNRLLIVPSLFWVETANALATKLRRRELERADTEDAWRDLCQAPLDVVQLEQGRAAEALRLAHDLGHPVYGCCYLDLACLRRTVAVTADQRFVRAVERRPALAPHIVHLTTLIA